MNLDFTKLTALLAEEKEIIKAQHKELKDIGFNEELRRLEEERDIDGLNDLVDSMPLCKATRFVYEAIIRLEPPEYPEREDLFDGHRREQPRKTISTTNTKSRRTI